MKRYCMDIDTQIELERDLLQICSEELMQKIVEYGKEFYTHLFSLFGLELTPNTVAQKESFVIATTRYYILNRLKKYIKPTYKQTNKFEFMFNDKAPLITKVYIPISCTNDEEPLKEHLTLLIEMASRSNKDDFATNFAKEFGVRKMLFEKELATSRDDSMIDFVQNVTKVYKEKK